MSKINKKKPTISVCMIVKDEEQLLDNCLESVKDIADEIIIIDTGSQDGTVDIAKKYTDKVYTRPDSGFYDTYRQFSIDQVSCPWVLLLNPYERLDISLKSNLDQLVSSDFDVFMLPVVGTPVQDLNSEGEGIFEPRLFKKDTITWSQTRHSQPFFHTNKAAKVNDGYILSSKKTPGAGILNKNDLHCKGLYNEHKDGDSPEDSLREPYFDLASHLKSLEKGNPQMGDNEAMYRFLYELSIS